MNQRIQSQETGSVRHAKIRAEKAKVAELSTLRKQELALKREQESDSTVKVEPAKVEEQSYDDHEWLVE